MKKLIVFIAAAAMISGCALKPAFEILDMVFDDDCLYRGTVEEVTHNYYGKATVLFDDGYAIACEDGSWIDVGDWIEAREGEDGGCLFSR